MAIDQDELQESAAAPAVGDEGPAVGDVDAEIAAGVGGAAAAPVELGPVPVRLVVAIAFPILAAAIMVGGIFNGVSARFYAAIAGLLGLGLGVLASRTRRPLATYALILLGLVLLGPLMLFPDASAMFKVTSLVRAARESASLFVPPVDFDPGWQAVVGWLMGIVGFTAAWVGLVLRWRALALLVPLPVAAIAAISVPESAAVVSGLVVLVLFAASLSLLSSEQAVDDDEERPSLAYELRKAAKAVPVLIVLILALLGGQKYLGFLFPDPVIDPAEEPQRPKVQPLNQVQDRVLFEIRSELTGPWRMGSLDVYDGHDWFLPPFADSTLVDVESDGVVDPEVTGRVEAVITLRGLGGAILPTLPNTRGIEASGPKLAYDARNANIRLTSGQVRPGFEYRVVAAGVPSVSELKIAVFDNLDPAFRDQFTEIPTAPAAVQALIDEAPTTSLWEQFDYLRNWVLENVTAKGLGTPVSITPDRVADMIAGTQVGTPYEIVAAQAMLARWIGLPARIAYGFDGGDKVNDVLQVRPRHGAAFVEVYFPGFKWLPVIGTPRRAEPTVGSDPSLQNQQSGILPSDDLAVPLFLPLVVAPESVVGKQVAMTSLVVFLTALGLYLLWASHPALAKLRLRARRRDAALRAGIRARVALAYTEWRDYAADLGFSYPTDTPLMFLDRFVDDPEHTELAWLATRVLWGDLRDQLQPEFATVAEELSRSLRRRLGATQPASVRLVGAISRLSLRHPYGPEVVELRSRLPRRLARRPRSAGFNGDHPGGNGARTVRPNAEEEHADASIDQ